jgi:hypothetical protein
MSAVHIVTYDLVLPAALWVFVLAVVTTQGAQSAG